MEKQKLEKEIGRDLETLALKLKALSEARGEKEIIDWGPLWGNGNCYIQRQLGKKQVHVTSSDTSKMDVFVKVIYRGTEDYRFDVGQVSPGGVFHSETSHHPYYTVYDVVLNGLGMGTQFAYGRIHWFWT